MTDGVNAAAATGRQNKKNNIIIDSHVNSLWQQNVFVQKPNGNAES
jgi:hypothetical protein